MQQNSNGIKGCIIAGGLGTRLFPLTKACNKSLLPVGNVPLIYHPIKKLLEIGVTNVCVVTSPEAIASIAKCLGSGSEIDQNLRIQYAIQDRPGGISQAIRLAKDFAGSSPIIAILGDNVFDESLWPIVDHFNKNPKCAMVYTYEVDDPERFGVVKFTEEGYPEMIVEKPSDPPSNQAVVGVYAYPSECNGKSAFDFIDELKPSARGELEVTDLNNKYIPGHMLCTHKMSGTWIDCGTMESLKAANLWAWAKPS